MPRLTRADLEDRKSGLGASDVVEALGLTPWEGSGPMRLFLTKTSGTVEEETDPDKLSWLEWGHAVEPVIASWYEGEKGVQLLPGGHVRHREIPWLWATLDAKAPDRIIEVKNVGSAMAHHWNVAEEDGVPRYVRAQCLIGQACLGARLTDVVASIGGRPPHVWTVAWDEELVGLLLQGAAKFWERVQRGEAPPLDATPATKEYLRRMYPAREDDVILPSSPDVDDLAAERISAAIEEKHHRELKTVIDHKILEKIGIHDGIRGEGWSMSFRLDRKTGKRRQRFTAAALRDE